MVHQQIMKNVLYYKSNLALSKFLSLSALMALDIFNKLKCITGFMQWINM